MKHSIFFSNQIKRLVFLCVTCMLIFHVAHAQEWLWAKSYSGMDGINYEDRDEIIKSAFDSDGNIYIFGRFRQGAKINGVPILNVPMGTDSYRNGVILAKLDPQGNLIWKKMIKYSNGDTSPSWMELQGDKIRMTARVAVNIGQDLLGALYYLDTVLYFYEILNTPEEELPLPFRQIGNSTAFVTFDLDGNLLDEHFLQYENRTPLPGTTDLFYLSCLSYGCSPFHVDQSGNIYIYTLLVYNGDNAEDPLKVIVDNDRRYNFYMPRVINSFGGLMEWAIFKFSPDFELLWAKPLVSHTTGLIPGGCTPYDTVNGLYETWVKGLSFDEEDNLYISGYIELSCSGPIDGAIHEYPVHFYWDSTHYAIMNDLSTSYGLPFIVKYDTAGTVQWSNQVYGISNSGNTMVYCSFWCNVVTDSFLFVNGPGQEDWNDDSTIFFDQELTVPLSRSDSGHIQRGFLARYDRETGEFINHGIIPAEIRSTSYYNFDILNNHVVLMATYQPGHPNRLIARFRDDATFMSADTIIIVNGSMVGTEGISLHESGYLFAYLVADQPATFGDITVPCATGSNAVFALQYDPSLTIPYDYSSIADYAGTTNSLILYPNPAQSVVHLQLSNENEYLIKAELYNLNGQKLGEYKASSIALSTLSAGIYIVKVFTNKNSYINKLAKTD